MKICAIICEFNPFHNGHKYLIGQAKLFTGCDKVVCIMSGSFTQRGDICVMEKHQRARHAVLCGTDCVIEMPAAFSVAPAEVFAKGAIKILASVPEVRALAFGCESNCKADFLEAAQILNGESAEFKRTLESGLASGESYIKSYQKAFESVGGKPELLSMPNNILGVEYAKAILNAGADIEIYPIKRAGANFNDGELKENFSSAGAIRANVNSHAVKSNVPDCVFADLRDFSEATKRFNEFICLILTRTDAETLGKIYGCGEGLNNKLKSLESLPFEEIISGATSKRYSSSRIRRILCANFLNLYKSDCESFLNAPLYLKPLAVKKECADEMLSSLAKSSYPLITKGREKLKLDKTAQKCLNKDEFAYEQWKLIAGYKNAADGLITI